MIADVLRVVTAVASKATIPATTIRVVSASLVSTERKRVYWNRWIARETTE